MKMYTPPWHLWRITKRISIDQMNSFNILPYIEIWANDKDIRWNDALGISIGWFYWSIRVRLK